MNLSVRRVEDRGSINLRTMPPDLSAAFTSVGITSAELEKIAGSDSVIRGDAEVKSLLARVDDVAKSGKPVDLARANNLKKLIDRALSRPSDIEPAAIKRSGVGLHGANGPYRASLSPKIADAEASPKRKCLFVRIFE